MKNIFFILLLGIFANANDFEDKYYKCTIIANQDGKVSQRLADTQGKSNLDLAITREKLFFDNAQCRLGCPYKYTSSKKKTDVYHKNDYDRSEYFFDEKSMRYFEIYPEIKWLTIYECKNATFIERSVMKSKIFGYGYL